MKALVLTGIKQFEIQELDTPEIQPNEVLINTAYAGVCGTDHDLYAGRPGSAPAVPPIILGHENSGVVAAIGSEVTNVKGGDRVAVDPNPPPLSNKIPAYGYPQRSSALWLSPSLTHRPDSEVPCI